MDYKYFTYQKMLGEIMRKLLYVDDEILNLELFKITYCDEYDIYTSNSAEEGLRILEREEIDVIITDYNMPKMNGVEFVYSIKKQAPKKVCMMLTGYMDSEQVQNAIKKGDIYKCILKPWRKTYLMKSIEAAFESIEPL